MISWQILWLGESWKWYSEEGKRDFSNWMSSPNCSRRFRLFTPSANRISCDIVRRGEESLLSILKSVFGHPRKSISLTNMGRLYTVILISPLLYCRNRMMMQCFWELSFVLIHFLQFLRMQLIVGLLIHCMPGAL